MNWVALLAAISLALAAPVSASARNGDSAMASDGLPPALLEECDAQAAAYDRFDPAIVAATGDLAALGVFAKSEFRHVKIGFCNLAGAGGPVATTSCESATILLDAKYRRESERFTLAATLAHEMKHHFQHVERRVRHGHGYCASDQYRDDRAALEEEADAFGDAVAALLYLGREVEVRNECPVAVEFYLEPASPNGAAPAAAFISVAPFGSAIALWRASAPTVRYYARARSGTPPRIWAGGPNAERRNVGGERVRLRRERLAGARRAEDAFTLTLRCD